MISWRAPDPSAVRGYRVRNTSWRSSTSRTAALIAASSTSPVTRSAIGRL
jgi:hypothetical protein